MSRRAAHALLFASLACVGCGESETETEVVQPPPGPACLPPNRVIGERCLEPGVQDDGCPAGTLGLEDGSCRPAGVPPELCAEGFVHDGDAACEPTLPAETCPKGTMAVPGEDSCHPVMSCGAGRWGDIPIDGASVHVDGAYTGGGSDGSAQKPWTTITEAVAAAQPGALIAIAAGSYLEELVVNKSVRLWGVCPDDVEIVGTNTGFTAPLQFVPGASGSELHGVAITGNAFGIAASGVEDVLIQGVWVHDTVARALNIESTLGPTSFELYDVLLEQAHELGAYISGAEVTLERVVVRGTLPQAANQELGRGIQVQDDTATLTPATVAMERSLVEDNRDVGVNVLGSHATLHGVVVRRTGPQTSDQTNGFGVAVQIAPASGAPGSAVLSSTLVEDNTTSGVNVQGADATLEGVVVRRTAPGASDQRFGRGIEVFHRADIGIPSRLFLKSSLVEDNHDVGVLVSTSHAELEGLLVRRTLPQASDLKQGSGIMLQLSTDPALLKGSLVEDNRYMGVYVYSAVATIEGVVVRRTSPRESDHDAGVGLAIHFDLDSLAMSAATVKSSIVEDNHEFGVIVNGSMATLDAVVVRRTQPDKNGFFGDGVAIASLTAGTLSLVSDATMTHSRIEENARAGFASFGAQTRLGTSTLSCNVVDLDGESVFGLSHTLENLGENLCGCPEPSPACAAKSSGLAPPGSLQ